MHTRRAVKIHNSRFHYLISIIIVAVTKLAPLILLAHSRPTPRGGVLPPLRESTVAGQLFIALTIFFVNTRRRL